MIETKTSHMTTEKARVVLEIKPTLPPSENPVIDHISRKMLAALMLPEKGGAEGLTKEVGYLGTPESGSLFEEGVFYPKVLTFSAISCPCGKSSQALAHFRFPNGVVTGSLGFHYLTFHREEVPEDDIAIINKLPYGEVEVEKNHLY